MVVSWDRIEPWDYIVSHVADEYSKKYTMVAREDIKQSLYEWFVSHPRKLTEWEKLGHRSTQNLLYRSQVIILTPIRRSNISQRVCQL